MFGVIGTNADSSLPKALSSLGDCRCKFSVNRETLLFWNKHSCGLLYRELQSLSSALMTEQREQRKPSKTLLIFLFEIQPWAEAQQHKLLNRRQRLKLEMTLQTCRGCKLLAHQVVKPSLFQTVSHEPQQTKPINHRTLPPTLQCNGQTRAHSTMVVLRLLVCPDYPGSRILIQTQRKA